MTMNGKMTNISLKEIYEKQMENQQMLIDNHKYANEDSFMVPCDNVSLSSYHIQQLMSEIGEVLDADKRWKNFRNDKYDKEAKVEEIADCFIVLMNVAMFSDISPEMLEESINEKIKIVKERISKIDE